MGQLLNTGKRTGCNFKVLVKTIDKVPQLLIVALRDIEVGEELLFDYEVGMSFLKQVTQIVKLEFVDEKS